MINWGAIFMAYVIISGLCLYKEVHQIMDSDIKDDKLNSQWEDILSEWYVLFGNKNVMPIIEIIALLCGWIIYPMSVFECIKDRFKF